MAKISIIIPVYNGEEYLEQCIHSVLSQTFDEMEILCIDDGSTDRSSEIIRRCQAEDGRIYLYHQKNQGAGAARNLGIQLAKGKYIAFLDADDYYLEPDALSLMYKTCEAKKMAACGSLRKHIKNGILENEALFHGKIAEELPCGAALRYQDFQLDYNYQSFLFLREHLTENRIYFPNYRRFQDPPFLVRALYTAGSFMVENTYLYCYRLSDMAPRFDRQKTCDLLHGLMDNLRFAGEHKLEVLFANTVQRLEDEYVDIICRNISPEDPEVLELLMQANQMICGYYGGISYVVQPLRTLMYCMYRQYVDRNNVLRMVEGQDEIVLYGAGKYGRLFFSFLKRNNLHNRISAFVVSDLKGNGHQIEGIPIIAFQEFLKGNEKLLLVAVRRCFWGAIEENLMHNGYKNYKFIEEELLHAISAEEECLHVIAAEGSDVLYQQ